MSIDDELVKIIEQSVILRELIIPSIQFASNTIAGIALEDVNPGDMVTLQTQGVVRARFDG